MTKLILQMYNYMEYPFVRYAFLVGGMIAVCAAPMGVILILRRYSFVGEGLSHVAFSLMTIASVLNLIGNTLFVLSGTIIVAVLLFKKGEKIRGDAVMAMLSAGSLAMGYLLLNLFGQSSSMTADVCTTLFGSISILTLSAKDALGSMILCIILLSIFYLFYHRFFAITFDENFAKATGQRVELYNLILAMLLATVIVLGMKLVGSLLISALIVFPPLSAMKIADTFKRVVVISAVLSLICTISGMTISILSSTPVGATIVGVNILCFISCSAMKGIKNQG